MKSFEKKYLENLRIPAAMLSNIAIISEYKGKEELYMRQSPDVLERLLEIAIIQSTESSNRIEGITAPYARIEKLVQQSTKPRNRPEQEIAGYRGVLDLIHQSYLDIPFDANVILQFHSMLYRFTSIKAGNWKSSDNKIIEKTSDGSETIRFLPVKWAETPQYMQELVRRYNEELDKQIYDPLLLVPIFVFDFLCIHPFNDGNGRIGRLLTLLLLYKAGYKVGKYISLERIIEDSKETYYDALHESSVGWHTGEHNIIPWVNYFYGMLLATYKEFESRVGIFKGRGSKTEQVKTAISKFIKPFSIVDIERSCPGVSRDMIRKVLRDLRDSGQIKPTGMGRGAMWEKVGN